jgi:MerR family copper efflux transcriptional regulator
MNISTALPIGELARQSGFSTDTLRYYEKLGLVPPPARTENGRRTYNVRALDRLRFIARAKELGCSLDEIAGLLSAYDDDCGDVQVQMRELVESKITDAQRRVTELIKFTAQLQEARHTLSAGASSGPCGPDCACVGAEPSNRLLTVVPLSDSDPAIACTLGHGDLEGRIAEWQAILATVAARETLDGGIRLTLGAETNLAEVTRLARAEWGCCSFFAFAITVDDRGVALEVRAPADARELLTSVFGVAS